MSVLVYT